MAFRSTREDWGTVAKTLHWAMAIGVLTMLACGVAMVWFLDGSLRLKFSVYQFHKSLGFVLLCLAAVRLSWRLVSVEKPILPPGLKPHEHWLAAAVHTGLYVCLCALPLVGWGAASASPLNIPTTVFGLFTLPRLVGPNAAVEHILIEAHTFLAWSLTGLFVLHVGGALWHHVVRRDDALRRMLPGKPPGSRARPVFDRLDS